MPRGRKQSFNTTGAGGMAAGDAFPTGTQKSVMAKQENNNTLRQFKEHKNYEKQDTAWWKNGSATT